jgi:L-amino acid N-acyltransferase YncA
MTMIRPATASDAAALCELYNYYVANTVITFETEAVVEADMAHRIAEITVNYPWLVAEDKQGVVGYAYASRWRARAAYDKTVETTIYLRNGAAGSGIGRPLYEALIDALRKRGFHALVGCITVPNPPSIAFHEKCGFAKVAHFPEVGNKFGKWVDVGFWQLTL